MKFGPRSKNPKGAILLEDDNDGPHHGKSSKTRKFIQALKCAAPGCTGPKKNSAEPDEGEEVFSYGDHYFDRQDDDDDDDNDDDNDDEDATDRVIILNDQDDDDDDDDGGIAPLPVLLIVDTTESLEMTYSDTTTSWDILTNNSPNHDDNLLFDSSQEIVSLKRTPAGLSNVTIPEGGEEAESYEDEPLFKSRLELDILLPVTTDLLPDSSGQFYIPNNTSEEEREKQRIEQNMAEIMEAAKVRQGKLEHKKNKKARAVRITETRTVPTAAETLGDVDCLLKRVDRLQEFLEQSDEEETVSTSKSGGLNSMSTAPINLSPRVATLDASTTTIEQRAASPLAMPAVPDPPIEAPMTPDRASPIATPTTPDRASPIATPGTPDRGPPPDIQPSVSSNIGTRPFFWRSHPGPKSSDTKKQKAPTKSKNKVAPIYQPHKAVIENPPSFINSVALTPSVVVLTPKRRGHLVVVDDSSTAASSQKSCLRPPLSPWKSGQRHKSGITKVRFDDSFGTGNSPTTAAIVDITGEDMMRNNNTIIMKKMVNFPDTPANATSYNDAVDFHWAGSVDEGSWSDRNQPWASPERSNINKWAFGDAAEAPLDFPPNPAYKWEGTLPAFESTGESLFLFANSDELSEYNV